MKKGIVLKTILVAGILFTGLSSQNVEAATTNFKDIQNHWAENSITSLTAQNLIGGYEDGTFRPNKQISQAEFVSLIVRVAGVQVQNGNNFGFPKHWAKASFETAYANGFITTGEISQYKNPNKAITRLQMVVLMDRALGLKPLDQNVSPFIDVDNDYVNRAYEEYLISGYETPHGNEMRPNNSATRAEAVAIISNLLAYKKDAYDYKVKKEQAKQERGKELAMKEEKILQLVEAKKQNREEMFKTLRSYPVQSAFGNSLEEIVYEAVNGKSKDYYNPTRLLTWAGTAEGIMETEYNRDYRTIGDDFYYTYLSFFGDWVEGTNGEDIDPRNYIRQFMKDTKEKKIIVQGDFITEPGLFYVNEFGYVHQRGRLFFQYEKGSATPKGIQSGQWYEQDIEVRLAHVATNLQKDWKHPEHTYVDATPLSEARPIR